MPKTKRLLFSLGLLSLVPYLIAWQLGDLRRHTVGFELAFFTAFGLYAVVTGLALRLKTFSRWEWVGVFGLAALFQGFLIFTPPTLSDDMYRYVWDGRVQAQGISPYLYPPKAPELAYLRDETVWKHINRKAAITVYPPAAEMAYAFLWRIWPDSVRWFQIVVGLGSLLAGGLLVGLLQALGRAPARVLIYLWSPLLAFETAHAAHVDGLILPLLVGAWWARVKERDMLVGVLLGLATAMKLYPALLLPALWRPHHSAGRWRMPVAYVATIAVCYWPYLITSGRRVLGYLPRYFGEQFNLGLAGLLQWLLGGLGVESRSSVFWLILVLLLVISAVMVTRPTRDGEAAVRRSIWLGGTFLVLTPNLFPWYLLWLLPLVALFLLPGQVGGVRADAWTGWWLFCGSVALSYTFFINFRLVPFAHWGQFLPLYLFLLIDLARRLKQLSFSPHILARKQQSIR
jgi:alpha-1,6-mannosyltransferase